MTTMIDRFWRHLNDQDSHHRRIAVGFLWVAFFSLIGRLASVAKEMALAWRYGVSEKVDAYVFVFNLISLPVSIWFSVLTVVLLPLMARVRQQNPEVLPRFRGELLGLTLAAGAVMGCLAYLFMPLLLTNGWAGFSGAALEQAMAMAGPLSLLLPMGLVISLFSAWMMANHHHRNTLLEALPALAILGMLLLPQSWAFEPLIWGSVAGFALQLAGLGWPLQRSGELTSPVLGFQSPAWKGFWGSFGIMAAGQAMMSFSVIIDQFFAAHLGVGAISSLSYANRFLSLILSLGAMAISRATMPIFSDMNVQNCVDMNILALRWAQFMCALGLAVLILGYFSAYEIVRQLLERGSFNADDTNNVTLLLQYSLIQVPFYAFALTLVSLFASQRKYVLLLVSGAVGLTVKILAATLLVPVLKINGLALSNAFVYLATAIFFYVNIKIHRSVLKNEA
jgi:putative peptidoglycan lipid II flippase